MPVTTVPIRLSVGAELVVNEIHEPGGALAFDAALQRFNSRLRRSLWIIATTSDQHQRYRREHDG